MQQITESLIYWGGKGPLLHLAHANSFHPGTYSQLIDILTQKYSVYTTLARPFLQNSPMDEFNSFNQLADDFIGIAKESNWKQIIGVGHSQGALMSLIVNSKIKGVFNKLILLEPPIIKPYLYPLLRIFPYSYAKDKVPPSKIALKRNDRWKSKEDAFLSFRNKSVFSGFSDQALWDMVNFGTRRIHNGVELTHSKEWESKIYCSIKNPWPYLKNTHIPTLAIRGTTSNVITDEIWEKWKQRTPHFDFMEIIDSGHLFPIERPQLVAQNIIDFLS